MFIGLAPSAVVDALGRLEHATLGQATGKEGNMKSLKWGPGGGGGNGGQWTTEMSWDAAG